MNEDDLKFDKDDVIREKLGGGGADRKAEPRSLRKLRTNEDKDESVISRQIDSDMSNN